MRRIPVDVKPGFYISTCICILLLPIKWLMAWVCAAAFHELCHFAAIRLCGNPVYAVSLDGNGASIITESLSGRKGMICALAGPLGALTLLLFLRVTPRAALCALVQSAYNLLPFHPLDGGRALLYALRGWLGDEKGDAIYKILCCSLWVVFFIGALYGMLALKLGALPFMAVILLFVRYGNVKIPCKQWFKRVQ